MIRIVGLSATLPNYLEVGIRFFGCVGVQRCEKRLVQG